MERPISIRWAMVAEGVKDRGDLLLKSEMTPWRLRMLGWWKLASELRKRG